MSVGLQLPGTNDPPREQGGSGPRYNIRTLLGDTNLKPTLSSIHNHNQQSYSDLNS